ncbi:MAG: RNA polymerase sigma factor [Cyclobacteriaceae bacterium]
MIKTNKKEFLALVQQHGGVMQKIIRLYVDDPEERQDMLQEILLQAWRSYPSFQRKSKFSTWLYRVSLNTVLTAMRQWKRQPKKTDLETVAQLAAESADTSDREWLYRSIRLLPEVDRMIITLHLDGYQNEEIADITGMQKGNVALKLHRIKKKLTEKGKVYEGLA